MVKNIHSAVSPFERTWQHVLLLSMLREKSLTSGEHGPENPVEVEQRFVSK